MSAAVKPLPLPTPQRSVTVVLVPVLPGDRLLLEGKRLPRITMDDALYPGEAAAQRFGVDLDRTSLVAHLTVERPGGREEYEADTVKVVKIDLPAGYDPPITMKPFYPDKWRCQNVDERRDRMLADMAMDGGLRRVVSLWFNREE